jgi:hypothetical protein
MAGIGRNGSREFFWRDLISCWDGKTSASGDQLMFCPLLLEIIESSPERCYPPLNLECVSMYMRANPEPIRTISCLTTDLLKSSGPVYTPIVTKYPPSTCSSLRLLSLSFTLATLSFSSFRASLSCFVSLRSGTSACELDPMPRNERSGLLPLWPREAYIGCGCCPAVGEAGPLAPPSCSCRFEVVDGESGPRGELVLLPMMQILDPQPSHQLDIENRMVPTALVPKTRLKGRLKDERLTWSRS